MGSSLSRQDFIAQQTALCTQLNLKLPTEAALELAWQNYQSLVAQLGTRQSLALCEFINSALYHPQCGYYTSGELPFGPSGDFITAPETSPLFAAAIADYITPQLTALDGQLVELGAGTGALAVSLWQQLSGLKDYWIVETSALLRDVQRQQLAAAGVDLQHCHWVTTANELPPRAFIIGNEVLDAIPAYQARCDQGQWLERRVILDQGNWQLDWLPAQTPALREWLANHQDKLPNIEGYIVEAAPLRSDFCRDWLDGFEQAVVLFLDYGFDAGEFFAESRHQGSLRCYYQHQCHEKLTLLPGLQDITSHVNFSELCGDLENQGWQLSGFCSQRDLILNSSAINDFSLSDDLIERAQQSQALQILMMPGEMGDRVKAIAFTLQFSENAEAIIPTNLVTRL
ncbi:MAG: SAM-dependent methyltransferase [Gammaproteobacteria bacterium]|nr:SAM-dependent methyltransferase [Gammaproteobacteria bacterium]